MAQTCPAPHSVQGRVRGLPLPGETHLLAWQPLRPETTRTSHWQLNRNLFLYYSSSNRNSLILVSLKTWKQSYQKSLNQRIWISDNNNIYESLPKIAEDVFVFTKKKAPSEVPAIHLCFVTQRKHARHFCQLTKYFLTRHFDKAENTLHQCESFWLQVHILEKGISEKKSFLIMCWHEIQSLSDRPGKAMHICILYRNDSYLSTHTAALSFFFLFLLFFKHQEDKKKSPNFFPNFWILMKFITSLGYDYFLYVARWPLLVDSYHNCNNSHTQVQIHWYSVNCCPTYTRRHNTQEDTIPALKNKLPRWKGVKK